MLGYSVATGNIKNVTCAKKLRVRFTTVILRSYRVTNSKMSKTIRVANMFAAYRIANYYLEVSIVPRMFTNQTTQRFM